jgi:hypothetical protein
MEEQNRKKRPLGKMYALTLLTVLSFICLNCGQLIPDMGITILAPKGNDVVKAETSYEIQWKIEIPESEVGKMVIVQFSKDGGNSWEKVEENVVNSGKYVWKVPKVESKQCKVRIYSQDKSKYRGTSEIFSVM